MMTAREVDKLVEGYVGTDSGYLNGFSYSKHDDFYLRYCDLDVDVAGYRARCGTTRKAFIQILKDAKPRNQAKIICGVFEMLPPPDSSATDEHSRKRLSLYKELLDVAKRLGVCPRISLRCAEFA